MHYGIENAIVNNYNFFLLIYKDIEGKFKIKQIFEEGSISQVLPKIRQVI